MKSIEMTIELAPIAEKKTWNTPEFIQMEKSVVQAGGPGVTDSGFLS